MIIAMVAGLAGGLLLGVIFNVTIPGVLSFYVTMGLLAAMDSLLGAIRSSLQRTYNNLIFLSGFLVNTLLAAGLVYLGDRLGIPLYYAVIFVFGGRLFQNIAVIRRILLDRYILKKNGSETGQ